MKSPHIVQSKGGQSGCQNEGKNEVFMVPPPHVYSMVFQLLGLRERERENEIKPLHVFLSQVLYLFLVFYRIGPHRCLYSSTATVIHIYSCNDRKITTHTISRISNALFPLWGHSRSGKMFLRPLLYLNATVHNHIVP